MVNFEQTTYVVHASIRCSYFLLQQPLRGEIIKIFGKEGEPYMGGGKGGGLDNSLETMR